MRLYISSFLYMMSRLRSQTFSGLPLSTKMAWLFTSRQLMMEPAADWPSQMKTIVPLPFSFFLSK